MTKGHTTEVSERYDILEKIGAGGMAEVFAAFDRIRGERVALKFFRTTVSHSQEAKERFLREGRLLLSFDHPHIVRVHDSGELADESFFLAMELLPGGSLREHLKQRWPLRDVWAFACQAAGALLYAHSEGVIHRDLKPENLFVLSRDPMAAKVLDFGVAKVASESPMTQTGQILGTPKYMSPEQLTGVRDIDGRTDVYSLGLVLYEMLIGESAFSAGSSAALIVKILDTSRGGLADRTHLPEQWKRLINQMTHFDRNRRCASMLEVVERLQALLSDSMDTDSATAIDYLPTERSVVPRQAVGEAGTRAAVSQAAGTQAAGTQAAGTKAAVNGPPLAATQNLRGQSERPKSGIPPTMSLGSQAGGWQHTSQEQDAQSPASLPEQKAGTFRHLQHELEPKPKPKPEPVPQVDAKAPVPPPSVAPGPMELAPPVHVEQVSAPAVLMPQPTRRRSILPWVLLVVTGLVVAAVGLSMLPRMLERDAAHQPTPSASSANSGTREPQARGTTASDKPSTRTVTPTATEGTDEHTSESAHSGAQTLHEPVGHTESARVPNRRNVRLARPTNDPDRAGLAPQAGPTQQAGQTPLERATTALREGHPEQCIELLEGPNGQTPQALRRRADCYLAAGRRADAVATYQRFCRLAPDHPSIGAVRRALAELSATCP